MEKYSLTKSNLFFIWLVSFLIILSAVFFLKNNYQSFDYFSNQQNIPKVLDNIEQENIRDRFSFHPAFSQIKNLIEDGPITWALTDGGVFRYDREKKEVEVYSFINGLQGGIMWDMVKRDNEIWVSTSYGINKIDIENGKVSFYAKKIVNKKDSWEDMFSFSVF